MKPKWPNTERFFRMLFARTAAFVSSHDDLTVEDMNAHIDWLERRQSQIAEDLRYWKLRRFNALRTHTEAQHGTQGR